MTKAFKEETFVGIDQALRKIGLCVFKPGISVELVLIKPPRNLRGAQRLTYLKNQVYTALQHYAPTITKAAIEAQSYGSMGDLDQLGQINGVMQVLLTELGAPPLCVPPAVLKKFVTGNGQARKDQMRRATRDYWHLDIDQDDLCDAYGLARFAWQVQTSASLHRHHIETVYRFLHRTKKRKLRLKKLFPNTL